MFISFEKQHGDRDNIEEVILGKRRFQYEEVYTLSLCYLCPMLTHANSKQEIKLNPRNYDIWFDYIRLEETNGNSERIREVFERAIGNVPPTEEKRFWRRYIYLWINYAIYEELEAQV